MEISVRNFLLSTLFLPSIVSAESVTVNKPVSCSNATETLNAISEQYQEKPFWFGKDDVSSFTLLVNKETKTWTFAQINFDQDIICLIDYGDNFYIDKKILKENKL